MMMSFKKLEAETKIDSEIKDMKLLLSWVDIYAAVLRKKTSMD